jgi:hypothetical protein
MYVPIPHRIFLKIMEMVVEADLASLRAGAALARPDARPSKLSIKMRSLAGSLAQR